MPYVKLLKPFVSSTGNIKTWKNIESGELISSKQHIARLKFEKMVKDKNESKKLDSKKKTKKVKSVKSKNKKKKK